MRACCCPPPPGKAVSGPSYYSVPIIIFSVKSSEAATQTWNLTVKSGLLFSLWFEQVGCRCEHHFLLTVSFFFIVSGERRRLHCQRLQQSWKVYCFCVCQICRVSATVSRPWYKGQGCTHNSSLMECSSHFLCPLNSKLVPLHSMGPLDPCSQVADSASISSGNLKG